MTWFVEVQNTRQPDNPHCVSLALGICQIPMALRVDCLSMKGPTFDNLWQAGGIPLDVHPITNKCKDLQWICGTLANRVLDPTRSGGILMQVEDGRGRAVSHKKHIKCVSEYQPSPWGSWFAKLCEWLFCRTQIMLSNHQTHQTAKLLNWYCGKFVGMGLKIQTCSCQMLPPWIWSPSLAY